MLPDNVKKMAMDAVSDKHTTTYIRLHSSNAESKPLFNAAADKEPAPENGYASRELLRREEKLKLYAVRYRAAAQAAEMNKSPRSVDDLHRQVTKDGFGRDHE